VLYVLFYWWRLHCRKSFDKAVHKHIQCVNNYKTRADFRMRVDVCSFLCRTYSFGRWVLFILRCIIGIVLFMETTLNRYLLLFFNINKSIKIYIISVLVLVTALTIWNNCFIWLCERIYIVVHNERNVRKNEFVNTYIKYVSYYIIIFQDVYAV